MANRLPEHAKRFGSSKSEIRRLYRHLTEFHGISAEVASERIHEIKEKLGFAADYNLIFGQTGDVYDPVTLEWIGSLTVGGKK